MAAVARQPRQRVRSTVGQVSGWAERGAKPLSHPHPLRWVRLLTRIGQVGMLVSLLLGCLTVHALSVVEGQRLVRCRQQQTLLMAQVQGLRTAIERRFPSLLSSPISRPVSHSLPTLLTVRKGHRQVAASPASQSSRGTRDKGHGTWNGKGGSDFDGLP